MIKTLSFCDDDCYKARGRAQEWLNHPDIDVQVISITEDREGWVTVWYKENE